MKNIKNVNMKNVFSNCKGVARNAPTWVMMMFLFLLAPFWLHAQGTCTPEFKIGVTPTNVKVYCEGSSTVLGAIALELLTPDKLPYRFSYDEGATWDTVYSHIDTMLTGMRKGTYFFLFTDIKDSCTFDVGPVEIGIEEAPPVEIGTIHVAKHPTCGNSNGSIILYVSGGSGGYKYAVSPPASHLTPHTSYLPYTDSLISGLPAGTYQIMIIDTIANCPPSISDIITLRDSSDLFVSIDPENALTCTGTTGALVVTTTGGVPLYTYEYYKLPDLATAFPPQSPQTAKSSTCRLASMWSL